MQQAHHREHLQALEANAITSRAHKPQAYPQCTNTATTRQSWQTNTYFAYQGSSFFGLSSIPSVYIGDLFLLPFINLAIYKAFKDALSDGGMGVKILMMNFAVCLLVSSATMYGVHYMWAHDAYSGFIS